MKRVENPGGEEAVRSVWVEFTEAELFLAARIVRDFERYAFTFEEQEEAAHLLRLIDDALERRDFEIALDRDMVDALYRMLGRGYWQLELERRVVSDAMMRLGDV